MTKDLTKGSPFRLILEFALPVLAGMLFQQMYNMVDTMIVGRYLGVNALAGVGATGPINFLVLGFCMGICAGFAIPVAQQFGAQDEKKLRAYVANGVMIAAVFAMVITVATVTLCRPILKAMHTPADCYEEAYRYIVVIFSGIPFTIFYNMQAGYLRSLGDSRTPLFFLIFSSFLNVALDIFCIRVLRLGVMGASLATILSQAVSGLLCFVWILKKVPILHIPRGGWKLERGKAKDLCVQGVPMGLQYSITGIGSVILQTAINSLGAVAVAAATAANRALGFLGSPFDALGSTMATYGAQNVGASRYDRLNRGVFTASAIGWGYSLLAMCAAFFIGDEVARLFVGANGSATLIEYAQRYMIISTLFYPFLTLVNVMRFAVQGMGFSGIAIIAGVLEMIARAGVGLFAVPALGFWGVCMGGPFAWLMAGTFLVWAYFHCRRVLMSGQVVHHRYDVSEEIAQRLSQE